jgi:hypothetical protein
MGGGSNDMDGHILCISKRYCFSSVRYMTVTVYLRHYGASTEHDRGKA